MGGAKQERRKKIVINKPFQSKLVMNIALFPAIALGLIAVVTGIWCSNALEQAIATDRDMPNLMPLVYTVISFEVLAGVFLLLNSVRVSHRVAGPAYRICKSLERIRSGDLAFAVKLRTDDHLTEVADEMNRLLDWLNDNPPSGCVTRQMAAEQQAAEAAEQPTAATTETAGAR